MAEITDIAGAHETANQAAIVTDLEGQAALLGALLGPLVDAPSDWTARAACRHQGIEAWFTAHQQRRLVAEWCQGCVVRLDCLASALCEEVGSSVISQGVRGVPSRVRDQLRRVGRARGATSLEDWYAVAFHHVDAETDDTIKKCSAGGAFA